MSRDLRDPEKLGTRYLQLRKAGVPADVAVDMPVEDFDSGKWISAPPTEHHLSSHPDVHLLASSEDMSV